MGGFFDPNSGIMGFMSKLADVIILSILWFICSIPVVTIGASTTALYYTAVKAIRRDRSYILRSFWKSFKENFVQGTILWILFLAVILISGLNIKFAQEIVARMQGRITGYVLGVAYYIMMLVAIFTELYMFPVLSRFTLKNLQILKMSLFMSIRHLPYTLLMAVILIAVIVGTFYVPVAMFVAPAAGALLFSLPMERVLKQYIKEEENGEYKDKWYLE